MNNANTPKPSAKKAGARYMAAEDRERHILDGAVQLFAEKGFTTPTRDIADYLGIQQPLLYRYFSSKSALIERVYQEVFISRMKPEWEQELSERSVPLRDRLIRYLRAYCDAILHREWIRIFLFSALAGEDITKRYLKLLHTSTFPLLLREIYAEYGISGRRSAKDKRLDQEVLWGFHASFFYLGVRKWVYEMDFESDLDEIIEVRVTAFLNGVGKEFNERGRE